MSVCYCYICNDETSNYWVCTRCARLHEAFFYLDVDSMPARMAASDPIPDVVRSLWDPDLRMDEGL